MKNQYPFLNKKVAIPKGKEMDVQNIKSWLSHQPHIPKLSDEHVLLFLHSCYYSGEQTKETIDNYFSVRAQSPELFTGWQWSKLYPMCKSMYTNLPLPKTSPEGYRILLYRLRDRDPAKYNVQQWSKALLTFSDVQISEDGLMDGYIVIFDMKGYSMGHLARVTASLNVLKKFMIYIQDCHPARLKAVHIINSSSIAESSLALCKQFMKSELLKIIHLHSELSSLEKFLPLELLPRDYPGGLAPDTNTLHDDHLKMITSNYQGWLEDSEKLVADSKKRVSKPKNQILELEGSFKKLDID